MFFASLLVVLLYLVSKKLALAFICSNTGLFRGRSSAPLAHSGSFDLEASIDSLRAVSTSKGKLEAVIKGVWSEYGLEALYAIANESYASDLKDSPVQELVDNLSKRNEQASRKIMGPDLASRYILSLPYDVKNKKGSKGRSDVFDVFSAQDNETYKLKVFKDKSRYARELESYRRVSGVKDIKKQGKMKKLLSAFAAIVDTSESPPACIVERGLADLREMRDSTGSISGKPLKAVMSRMAESLAKIHGKGYVWCDVKLENFVIVPVAGNMNLVSAKQTPTPEWFNNKFYAVKAIDLESLARKGSAMTDFAPETVPPELASQLRGGKMGTVGFRDNDQKINPQAVILASQAYDIFALGICFLELARMSSGPVLGGSDLKKSFATLDLYVAGENDLGLSEVKDAGVRRLLEKMLSIDPSKRPSISQVQRAI